jgi:chemotaxis protein CheD
MVEESLRRGARRAALLAKITGGSRMFSFEAEAGRPPVGERNVAAALRALGAMGVRVAASDVGGECGRTVVADLDDGTLTITTLRGGPRVL